MKLNDCSDIVRRCSVHKKKMTFFIGCHPFEKISKYNTVEGIFWDDKLSLITNK